MGVDCALGGHHYLDGCGLLRKRHPVDMVGMNDVRRIAVVGISASGKSTFARKLAERTRLPLTHMDTIWWKPGWISISEEEATAQLRTIVQTDAWIVEGYIPKLARNSVFERADLILYLDYAPVISALRYIKRWWKHRKNARPELKGSPESFSFKFLKLVWTKGEAISLDKFLEAVERKDKIVRLTSPKKAREFLEEC
jgi:adenylate kinase family enzyme